MSPETNQIKSDLLIDNRPTCLGELDQNELDGQAARMAGVDVVERREGELVVDEEIRATDDLRFGSVEFQVGFRV